MTSERSNSGDQGAGRPTAVILAAGKGKRMKSDLPKVLHEVGGRPMVCAVLDACIKAGCGRLIVVVGHERRLVEEALREYESVEFAVQGEQLGTGHAVMCVRPLMEREIATPGAEVLVLCGDGPLIRSETLGTILERRRDAGAAATLATAVLDDPSGYGRIVRDEEGRFRDIVEQKNATEEQLGIREVNPSYYCFEAGSLFDALDRVERNPVSNEYYLTDVPRLLSESGEVVEVVAAVPPEDVLSINTPEDLARVDEVFRGRRARTSGSGANAAERR